jgi:hypothetical protein
VHPIIWVASVLALAAVVLGRFLPLKGNPAPLPNRLAYQIGSAGGAFAILCFGLLAPDWGKGIAVAVGALTALAVAWLVEWFEWPAETAMAGRVGALTLVFVAFCLIWPDPVVRSYALGGLGGGLAACHLFAVLYGQSGIGTGALMGTSLLGLAALSWLPRLLKPAGTTPAIWLLALGAASLGTAAAARAWPRRPVAVALLGGGVAMLVSVLGPRHTTVQTPNLWLPILLATAVAVAVALTPERDRSRGLGAMFLGILAILAVMAALRLGGTLGLAFFGIGLVPILGWQPAAWGAALLTVVGARSVLQLWLDRTNLTSLGLDLTHEYAFAGLVAGCLFSVVAAQSHQRFQGRRIVLLPLGWGLMVIPTFLGYLLHVEPLGTFVAGLVTVSLVWGLMQPQADSLRTAELAPALAGISVCTALLTAPWLISELNAPRSARIAVFLIGLALTIVFVAAATRRAPTRSEQIMDAD